MYWFEAIKVLREAKGEKLDIYEIATRINKKINLRHLRNILLKLYIKHPYIDREMVKEGMTHKYVYYWIGENHINNKQY